MNKVEAVMCLAEHTRVQLRKVHPLRMVLIGMSLDILRPDRMERVERMDRERQMMARQTMRGDKEQGSSRPPPPVQIKAKDPMKLVGLKSNIKLSLLNKVGAQSAFPSSVLHI